MSFSHRVKEELLEHSGTGRHCMAAEMQAILLLGGLSHESVQRKFFTLKKKTFKMNADDKVIEKDLRGAVLHRSCCKRAFLRGAFLSAGSVSDPQRSYHLEIVSAKRGNADRVKDLMHSFDLDAKVVLRKNTYVVYLKEGDQIATMLRVMEANVALLEWENVRIVNEMRGNVNRVVNCETANINKTVHAAVRQVNDIELIRDRVGFGDLSDSLREMAEVRLQYPQASLLELGSLLSPPVGKSGVNHRLRKLGAIADTLRN